MYLVAFIDWYSRYIVGYELSDNLETEFCIKALNQALFIATPEIVNSEQGSQFTSEEFTSILKQANIKISMDGKASYRDNILTERFWRTIKYEDIYIRGYQNLEEARIGVAKYIQFYNHKRIHQSLDYQVPATLYFE